MWCEGGIGEADAFEIVGRPAERLAGTWWQGSFEDAAAGGLRRLLDHVRGLAVKAGGLWAGPIVAVSRINAVDGFRTFAGFAIDTDASLDEGRWQALEVLELPPLRYVSAWHGANDGAVVDHYRGMLHWMQVERIRRDSGLMHHREEYPADADFAAERDLRLMICAVPAAAETGRFRAY